MVCYKIILKNIQNMFKMHKYLKLKKSGDLSIWEIDSFVKNNKFHFNIQTDCQDQEVDDLNSAA
jgi:hypothetical protein